MTDRTDPQLVHLDGEPEPGLVHETRRGGPSRRRPRPGVLVASAARHAESALEHVASGDYAGEHWLASFAVYLLTSAGKVTNAAFRNSNSSESSMAAGCEG